MRGGRDGKGRREERLGTEIDLTDRQLLFILSIVILPLVLSFSENLPISDLKNICADPLRKI